MAASILFLGGRGLPLQLASNQPSLHPASSNHSFNIQNPPALEIMPSPNGGPVLRKARKPRPDRASNSHGMSAHASWRRATDGQRTNGPFAALAESAPLPRLLVSFVCFLDPGKDVPHSEFRAPGLPVHNPPSQFPGRGELTRPSCPHGQCFSFFGWGGAFVPATGRTKQLKRCL